VLAARQRPTNYFLITRMQTCAHTRRSEHTSTHTRARTHTHSRVRAPAATEIKALFSYHEVIAHTPQDHRRLHHFPGLLCAFTSTSSTDNVAPAGPMFSARPSKLDVAARVYTLPAFAAVAAGTHAPGISAARLFHTPADDAPCPVNSQHPFCSVFLTCDEPRVAATPAPHRETGMRRTTQSAFNARTRTYLSACASHVRSTHEQFCLAPDEYTKAPFKSLAQTFSAGIADGDEALLVPFLCCGPLRSVRTDSALYLTAQPRSVQHHQLCDF